jgi:hypothetical protein
MEKYRRVLYVANADWRRRIDGGLTNRIMVGMYNAAKPLKEEDRIREIEYYTCSDVNSAIKYGLFRSRGVKQSFILGLLSRGRIGKRICFIIAEANKEAEMHLDRYLSKKYGIEKLFL